MFGREPYRYFFIFVDLLNFFLLLRIYFILIFEILIAIICTICLQLILFFYFDIFVHFIFILSHSTAVFFWYYSSTTSLIFGPNFSNVSTFFLLFRLPFHLCVPSFPMFFSLTFTLYVSIFSYISFPLSPPPLLLPSPFSPPFYRYSRCQSIDGYPYGSWRQSGSDFCRL